MFNFLFKEALINLIVEKITKEVNSSLARLTATQDQKLDLVLERIERLSNDLSGLELRLTQKELKDRTEYGQMHYKISALQSDLKSKNSSN